jgi:hypothetical protein
MITEVVVAIARLFLLICTEYDYKGCGSYSETIPPDLYGI